VAWLAEEADKAVGKRHDGWKDDSGTSEEEAGDGAALGGIALSPTDSTRWVKNVFGTGLG
jgi:hypothetical protein